MAIASLPQPLTPAATAPLRFTWRLVEGLVADRVLVTWVDHMLGYETALRVSRPNGELTLTVTSGQELPPDDFGRIVTEVAAILRRPVSPQVLARWEALCAFEPGLGEKVAEWPTIKLRGAMEHVARISIGEARVYVRMMASAGSWRKAVAK